MRLTKEARRSRIKKRIRKVIQGTPACPRLSVYRSNKEIYAQLIDDTNGVTLGAFSSKKAKADGSKKDVAVEVGKGIGEIAKEKGIEKVVFDRNGYLYHGRVKALAEGAREAGLKF
ncbi:MAG: 50S ribosomal protein L18 [Flavobacteriales bacterium]|nr:50S ribosomal protein L18 [Flavobacteriales bacterium]